MTRHIAGCCEKSPRVRAVRSVSAQIGRGSSAGRRALGLVAVLGWASACAGGGAAEGDRYPEKKRPEALRSASDGEVLGAGQQDPSDTLEGSLTNEHAAPRSPHAEEPAEAAHERLEYEECIEEQNKAAAAVTAGAEAAPRKRPVCTPPPEHDH
jgi:hypothetical protein